MGRERRGVERDMEETELVIVVDVDEDEDTAVGVKDIAEGLRIFWRKGWVERDWKGAKSDNVEVVTEEDEGVEAAAVKVVEGCGI